MVWTERRYTVLCRTLCAAVLSSLAACASSNQGPVRFATTTGSAEPTLLLGELFDEVAPFREIQKGITKAVGPTQFVVLKPEQIHDHLATGYVQVAFVDAADEQVVLADDAGTVIAQPTFRADPPTSTALFVVGKDSAIASLADCKGKRVAFGPPNHPALHWAALQALGDAGVTHQDLAKEILPIPGSLQHHGKSIESAKAAAFGIEADVGVVDEAVFMSWPETGSNIVTRALSISISRDQLKIIGRTDAIPIYPSGPVVASSRADPAVVQKVTHYLTEVLPKQKRIIDPIELDGYQASPER